MSKKDGEEILKYVVSSMIVLFGIALVVVFWFFLLKTQVLSNLYTIISCFVASHGLFIASIITFYLDIKNRSFIEQWYILIDKIKRKKKS